MTNKQLQELLKNYPDDVIVTFSDYEQDVVHPVGGIEAFNFGEFASDLNLKNEGLAREILIIQ